MPRPYVPIGSDYTDDEREFLVAVERYRRERRRPFPTCAEVLAVAKSMGYRRVTRPGPLPKPRRDRRDC